MSTRPWLDEVLKRLSKHALPSTYVQRLAEELSDHFLDLKEENMKTESEVYSRLGTPEEVADAAAITYRRRSFVGRHPTAAFLTFAVLPVGLMILSVAFMVLALIALITAAEYVGIINSEGFRGNPPGPFIVEILRYAFSLFTIIIPALIASIVFCKLSKWLGMGRKWMLVSCVALAITAVFFSCNIGMSVDAETRHSLQLGFAVPGISRWLHALTGLQVVQALVPLSIGCWFLRRYAGEQESVSIRTT